MHGVRAFHGPCQKFFAFRARLLERRDFGWYMIAGKLSGGGATEVSRFRDTVCMYMYVYMYVRVSR